MEVKKISVNEAIIGLDPFIIRELKVRGYEITKEVNDDR